MENYESQTAWLIPSDGIANNVLMGLTTEGKIVVSSRNELGDNTIIIYDGSVDDMV